MLDDFVQMWSAKERGRDGLVPDAFDDEANRRLLRQASTARALCIAAVVELTVLLFVASWLPTPVMAALWLLFALTTAAGVALAARSLAALGRVERAAAPADRGPADRGPGDRGPGDRGAEDPPPAT